jgi:hypothetical protein
VREVIKPYTVPKAVWKIFMPRNFPSQHGDSAGSLVENFYSATSMEEVQYLFATLTAGAGPGI